MVTDAIRPTNRRASALTHERVVSAAIDLLDAQGEGGLTFRALATALNTGHGAIQWHVANKTELLKAATSTVISAAVANLKPTMTPQDRIRTLALALFTVMDEHPWVGRQLVGSPWQPSMLWLFELIGREVQQLSAARSVQFSSTSALLTYIIGAGGREAANAQAPEAAEDRQDLLDAIAEYWEGLDSEEYGFTRAVTQQLRTHDDREVFLAGIDLILAGAMSAVGPDHP